MKLTVKQSKGIDSNPDIRKLRTEIFVEEQHFKNEFDDIDNSATHIVVYDDSIPIATGRTFQKDDSNTYIIGRIAVIKDYRKKSLGSFVVTKLEEIAYNNDAEKIELSAQTRVKDFYKKLGYSETGSEYFDEYCPHILMKKDL